MQGVSQQPSRDRLAGQCTEQLNMSCDPLSGLRKRSSTDLVNKLSAVNDAAFYDFQVKNGSKFILAVFNQTARVYDLNGTEINCTVDSGIGPYLSDVSKLKFATLNNDTYVVNTAYAPSMLDDVKQYRNTGSRGEATIQVIGGAYGRKYAISLNGTVAASYVTPNGSEPGDVVESSPTFIAQKLVQGIQAYSPDILISFDGGSTIFISSASQFTIAGTDDAGGTNMKVTKDFINRVEDLPPKTVDGTVVRVASKTDPEADLWYVFKANRADTIIAQDGYWQETIAPGTKHQINAASMPHVLEYNPDNSTFRLKREDWKERQVGTDLSNPVPSFIGNPINDVTSFQSRLVILSGASLCMSRTNRPTDFFQASASALADTDPIDISSTSVQGALLAGVPHNRDLVLFSKKGQFIVFGRAVITPKNASIVLTTSFEAELTAKPVPAGRNVFFTTAYGRFTGIREFYTEGATDINDSRPVTQHVKEYVTGKTVLLAASSNYETLLALADTDRRNIYVYQYIWADNSKVQSAWSTWRLHAPVQYMFFDQELIYYVCKIGSEHFLYRMSLDQIDSESVGFPVYLDSRFDVLNVNKEFVAPYNYVQEFDLVAVQGTDCPNPGMPVRVLSKQVVDGQVVVTLKDDMQGGRLVCGIPFVQRYVPTQPYVKDQDGVPIGTGNLTLKSFSVSMSKSAMIEAKITSEWGDSAAIKFDGRIVGEARNRVGRVSLTDAKFEIPVREKAHNSDVEIYSESYYPLTMLDIEWKGQYTKKGRRIAVGGSQ